MSAAGVILNAAFATDVGRHRAVNEDAVLAASPIFLVADGMGGHEAGDRASAAVTAAFAPLVGTAVDIDDVRAALSAATLSVDAIAAQHERGAGSTVSGAALVDHGGAPHWLVFNVGDSRVYRHDGHELTQVTVDHSLGQELVAAGELDAADLSTFARRNVITRAIGGADSTADSWLLPVVDGERLLICSDGLSGEVSDEAIRATLTMCGTPQSAAAALIRRALQAGGRDNVSVVVIDVVAGGTETVLDDSTTGRMPVSTLSDSLVDSTTLPVRSRG